MARSATEGARMNGTSPAWAGRSGRNPRPRPFLERVADGTKRSVLTQAGRRSLTRVSSRNNIREVGRTPSESSEPERGGLVPGSGFEIEAESRPGDSRPHLGNARPCSRLRRVDARRSRSAGSGSRAHIAARSDYTSSSAGAINSGSAKMRLRGCSSVG